MVLDKTSDSEEKSRSHAPSLAFLSTKSGAVGMIEGSGRKVRDRPLPFPCERAWHGVARRFFTAVAVAVLAVLVHLASKVAVDTRVSVQVALHGVAGVGRVLVFSGSF